MTTPNTAAFQVITVPARNNVYTVPAEPTLAGLNLQLQYQAAGWPTIWQVAEVPSPGWRLLIGSGVLSAEVSAP
jgi:hypothetical protein